MNLTKVLNPDPIRSPHHDKPITYDIRYLPDATPKPVIVFVHGFKGFKDWGYFNLMADAFAQSGFFFIKFNLSHNGTSPEHPTDFVDLEAFGNNNFSKEMNDTGSLLDYIHSPEFPISDREADLQRIFLMGHSRGGGLALMKTREDTRIKGVVTLAAVTDWEARWPKGYLEDWKKQGVQIIPNTRTGQEMPLYYQIVEDYFQHRERLHLPEAIRNIRVPILAFHGTADETVPHSMAEQLSVWNGQAEVEIVEGADHTFGGKHPFPGTDLPTHAHHVVKKSITFLKSIEGPV